MKFAILETISTSGGHEVEFDRMVIEELRVLGYDAEFYVPRGYEIKYNNARYNYLDAEIVSYVGLSGIKKLLAGLKRERNRQRCFAEMYERACRGEFEAIIVPTAGYRFLRALRFNKLKKSPVPVLFGFNGITPKEFPKFRQQVENLADCDNIRFVVQTCAKDIFAYSFKNRHVYCVPPPVYTPRDIGLSEKTGAAAEEPLLLGSFGQFRREKKLDEFIELFLSGNYERPVKLVLQGATVSPADSAEFERIINKYVHNEQLTFVHKGLWGVEWQEAINEVDVLLLPYGSERYRYSWSGMLFTAMGYRKPVIASELVLPDGFGGYDLGMYFTDGDAKGLLRAVEEFVNTYDSKQELYYKELAQAADDYAGLRYVKSMVKIAGACV